MSASTEKVFNHIALILVIIQDTPMVRRKNTAGITLFPQPEKTAILKSVVDIEQK